MKERGPAATAVRRSDALESCVDSPRSAAPPPRPRSCRAEAPTSQAAPWSDRGRAPAPRSKQLAENRVLRFARRGRPRPAVEQKFVLEIHFVSHREPSRTPGESARETDGHSACRLATPIPCATVQEALRPPGNSTTSLDAFASPINSAMRPATASAACKRTASAWCAYFEVMLAFRWPISAAMVSSLYPRSAATDAKECLNTCGVTSAGRPALAAMRNHVF